MGEIPKRPMGKPSKRSTTEPLNHANRVFSSVGLSMQEPIPGHLRIALLVGGSLDEQEMRGLGLGRHLYLNLPSSCVLRCSRATLRPHTNKSPFQQPFMTCPWTGLRL